MMHLRFIHKYQNAKGGHALRSLHWGLLFLQASEETAVDLCSWCLLEVHLAALDTWIMFRIIAGNKTKKINVRKVIKNAKYRKVIYFFFH